MAVKKKSSGKKTAKKTQSTPVSATAEKTVKKRTATRKQTVRESPEIVSTLHEGPEAGKQIEKLQGYYKFHSWIYDATRWSFLFGRNEIIQRLPELAPNAAILEVGCGTGKNLLPIAEKYPDAHLTGYDVSADMIRLAEKKMAEHKERVTFYTEPYGPQTGTRERFDLIVFSYALSMINPQYAEVIQQARKDLKPGGFVAVVDFYEGIPAYKKYMLLNHVRMDAHILPVLNDHFESEYISIRKAYGGVWKYMLYLGRKS